MSAENIMPLSFFEAGGVYTGQVGGMRYLIKKEDEQFVVSAWKGPFRYDAVEDELKTVETFDATDDVRQKIIDRLNALYDERREEWD